ncbi:2Fe-2S iron-sulfur cluster-binding protein [Streptomyces sp. NPDC046821]|uniref:2Fe-2S iron-sulfur cluster-binding protein n=1 Tax=Streptomyces sp. NPDC046821 TaxID=3154702 RepID=UPI0033D433B7
MTTVEGVVEEAEPMRRAFADEGGFQCGFCTPGQIMRALALLAESLAEELGEGAAVRAALAGNVCRCTGYVGIVRALQRCAPNQKQEPTDVQ